MNSWRSWGSKNDFECAPRLPGCGTQHPHRALGGTRILLAAAPTTPPCFRHWRRSSSLQRKEYFLICSSGKSADFPELPFHGWGRKGRWHICPFPCALLCESQIQKRPQAFPHKTKIGACRWSSCTSRFCFLCVGCGTKHSRCRAGSSRANRAAASRRKEKGMEEWSGALADAPFFLVQRG